jgi:hypothetical protein
MILQEIGRGMDPYYNIYHDPGDHARETIVDGMSYAAMIKDLFEDGP